MYEKQGLGYRYNYRLLQQSWLARKLTKAKKIRQKKSWCTAELAQFSQTLHGKRENNGFYWE